jgi:Tol biopolymer transport system component
VLLSWSYPGGVPSQFVLDRTTGSLVAAGVAEDGETVPASFGSISDTGRYVVFSARPADVVSGSSLTRRAVFVRDLVNKTTRPVSTEPDGTFIAGDVDGSITSSISGDGRFVVFTQERAPHRVYRKDLITGALQQIDRVACEPGPSSDEYAYPTMSDDGATVAFDTSAALVQGDTDDVTDVYLWRADRPCRVQLISRTADGGLGDHDSYWPAISGDGRHVAFVSEATNLVPGDTNGVADAFVWSDASRPVRGR